MDKISILFNSHKIKYSNLNEVFNKTNNKIYFYIDFDYLFSKFLELIENIEDLNIFLIEFLNLISHYKCYFYKHLDSISFYYISINVKKYKNSKEINDFIEFFIKIINLIPRVNIYYGEDDKQIFYLKYNLFKIISLTRKNEDNLIFLDIGNDYNNQLIYKLNKNYFQLRFNNYKSYLYNFDMFIRERFLDIEPIYINKILSIMSLFSVVNNVDINNKIVKFIKENKNLDYNNEKTINLIMKTFNLRKYKTKYNEIEHELGSVVYQNMIKIIMENWRHTIKDRNLYRINEIFNTDIRINIENLINY